MTRLPDGVSRSAMRRVATSARGDLTVVLDERMVTIKPKHARSNGIVTVTWGAIYERALMAELAAVRRARKTHRRAK